MLHCQLELVMLLSCDLDKAFKTLSATTRVLEDREGADSRILYQCTVRETVPARLDDVHTCSSPVTGLHASLSSRSRRQDPHADISR